MTVLDAFAGLALEALIGVPTEDYNAVYTKHTTEETTDVFEESAEIAYRFASAMLLARKKYL